MAAFSLTVFIMHEIYSPNTISFRSIRICFEYSHRTQTQHPISKCIRPTVKCSCSFAACEFFVSLASAVIAALLCIFWHHKSILLSLIGMIRLVSHKSINSHQHESESEHHTSLLRLSEWCYASTCQQVFEFDERIS